jgi:pimeloyl-ACP methyl ester carboxylesterase
VPRIAVDGVELNVRVEGDGEPVLLLHGFPDSAALWRKVVPELVRAGYRTVAFDQRGFGDSDAPTGTRNYALSRLAQDALGVMDALGIGKAHLVGHDWGSAVGWLLAGNHPERFRSFTALSVGHARAYAAAGFQQFKKAWYIVVALAPGVGEALARARDWRLFRVGTAGHPEADRWIADLSRPGRLTAAFNLYRANSLTVTDHPNLRIPALGVWSTGDVVLTEAQMTLSAKYVDSSWRYERFEGSSHWLPLDVPKPLSALLVDFFKTSASSPGHSVEKRTG